MQAEVPHMHFESGGFDRLRKELQAATEALKSLDGELGSVHFNPRDPASVDAAVAEVEAMVDARVAEYRGNHLVEQVVTGLKQRYSDGIRERARRALESG